MEITCNILRNNPNNNNAENTNGSTGVSTSASTPATTFEVEIDLRQPKIPRPANAFMLYANDNRKRMARLHPLDSNKEISKRLGKGWKELSQEQRNMYYALAKKVDAEHKKKYPDYVYNPKEARIRKAMRDASRETAPGSSGVQAQAAAVAAAAASASRDSRQRAQQPWVMPETDDQFMMTPSHGMRNMIGSPMCGTSFPIPNTQFMPQMHAYNKHMPIMPSQHDSYVSTNPMAQLQMQTEMWNQYHQNPNSMRSTSTTTTTTATTANHHHHHHDHQQEHYMMTTTAQLNHHHHHHHHPQTNFPQNEIQMRQPKTTPSYLNDTESTVSLQSARASTASPQSEVKDTQNGGQRQSTDLESNLSSQSDGGYIGFPDDVDSVQIPYEKEMCSKKKSLPDFNAAFGTTERGRYQSPPDPRLPPKDLDFDFFDTTATTTTPFASPTTMASSPLPISQSPISSPNPMSSPVASPLPLSSPVSAPSPMVSPERAKSPLGMISPAQISTPTPTPSPTMQASSSPSLTSAPPATPSDDVSTPTCRTPMPASPLATDFPTFDDFEV